MKILTTFPQWSEFEKAAARLRALSLPFDTVSPEPGFGRVGTPALILEADARMKLAEHDGADFLCSGWVDYRPAGVEVPSAPPADYDEDLFGRAAVMVLAPCVADPTKIRLTAHLSGDISEALPYLNAEMREASYNPNGPTFTFMMGHRMVSAYARRIAIAKADDLVDAWKTLEMIRVRVNDTWARRAGIQPSFEMRERPPALEIYKRLPRTNCKVCGEPTCLAFAVKVHGGAVPVSRCAPVFEGDFTHLQEALLETCAALGVMPADAVKRVR